MRYRLNLTFVPSDVTNVGMSQAHPLIEYASRPGHSMSKLARDAGCSRMTLYRLMRGEQNATIDLLKRVSAATGGEVPVSALFPNEGEA